MKKEHNHEDLVISLSKKYSGNPVIRGLIQLVPFSIGSALDTAITITAQKMLEERTSTFFDELKRGEIELTEDVVNSEDFIHKFFITSKSAINTRRKEKIQLFARLLKSSIIDPELNIDEFEELHNLLENLSAREILILTTLEKWEDSLKHSYMEILNKYDETGGGFWKAFLEEASSNCQIDYEKVNSLLITLAQKGLLEFKPYEPHDMIKSARDSFDHIMRAKLTLIYFYLKRYVEMSLNDFDL